MTKPAQLTKQLARREFDDWAKEYDRSLLHYFLFRPTYLTFLEEAARWSASRLRPLDWLDIGCGTGTLQQMARQSNLDANYVIGLDYALEMCQQARTKMHHTHPEGGWGFVHGDSEHLPFADGSFDLISCGNSFHHYPHQAAVVREMYRLLRPGGQLMIIDGFRDNVVGWVIFDVIITRIEKAVYHVPWAQMRHLFEQAGFREIRQRKFNLFFPAFVTIGTVA
ncbi:MAG: Demethylmenaquinone methyltransferase [Phycisphaerae bacterium]|nr:Demethylmenaquinone methyltransferase [Phycisphaerae bacterium]